MSKAVTAIGLAAILFFALHSAPEGAVAVAAAWALLR